MQARLFLSQFIKRIFRQLIGLMLALSSFAIVAESNSLWFYWQLNENGSDRSGRNHANLAAQNFTANGLRDASWLLDAATDATTINTQDFAEPYDNYQPWQDGFSMGFWFKPSSDWFQDQAILSFGQSQLTLVLSDASTPYFAFQLGGDTTNLSMLRSSFDDSPLSWVAADTWLHLSFVFQNSGGCHRAGVVLQDEAGSSSTFFSACYAEDLVNAVLSEQAITLAGALTTVDDMYYLPGNASADEIACLAMIGDVECAFPIRALGLPGRSGISLSRDTLSDFSAKGAPAPVPEQQTISVTHAGNNLVISYDATDADSNTQSHSLQVTPTKKTLDIVQLPQLTDIQLVTEGSGSFIEFQIDEGAFSRINVNLTGSSGVASYTLSADSYRTAIKNCSASIALAIASGDTAIPSCFDTLPVTITQMYFEACDASSAASLAEAQNDLQCVLSEMASVEFVIDIQSWLDTCNNQSDCVAAILSGNPGISIENIVANADKTQLSFITKPMGSNSEGVSSVLSNYEGDQPAAGLDQKVRENYGQNGSERYITETFVGAEDDESGYDTYVPVYLPGLAVVLPPKPKAHDLVVQFSDGNLINAGNMKGKDSQEVGKNYKDAWNDVPVTPIGGVNGNQNLGINQFADNALIALPSGFTHQQCTPFKSANASLTRIAGETGIPDGWRLSLDPSHRTLTVTYEKYTCTDGTVHLVSNLCELVDINCSNHLPVNCGDSSSSRPQYTAQVSIENRATVNVVCSAN